jgi:hypothetical protein
MDLFRQLRSALLALGLFCGPAHSETTVSPTGPVILTVTGLDEADFPGGAVAFDRAMLDALGKAEITTSSIWTDGVHVYGGVMLKDLADHLNISSKSLTFHALNDYSVEFPATEATKEGPILAYEFDGTLMSVREKGPIWVMYPFDSGAKYRTDTNFSRSIWQLDRIDVLR